MVASWSAFWANAGVDAAFVDEPTDWLAQAAAPAEGADGGDKGEPRPRPRAAKPAEPEAPRIGGAREDWPDTLDAFHTFWMNDPSLDPHGTAQRVAPVGKAGARLMVLVTQPARDDGTALLSGEDGAMLDAMLAAMGLSRDDCYLAAVLPRHTPAPDWAALEAAGLGDVLRHHVALARPQMIAAFGSETVRLLEPARFDTAAMTGGVTLGDGDAAIPLIAGYPLAAIARRPRAKALWWHRWLGLSQPA